MQHFVISLSSCALLRAKLRADFALTLDLCIPRLTHLLNGESILSFSIVLHFPFPVPLQRTSRCVSSRTPGRERALSPRLTSTGRWPLCSAHRRTATLTSLSPLESRCSSAGPLTARSASQWTSSTCPLTQVRANVPVFPYDVTYEVTNESFS